MQLSSYLRCRHYRPKRVLGISKLSAWEFLKFTNPKLSKSQLVDKLIKQGKDPKEVIDEHRQQLACEDRLAQVLKKLDISFRISKRIAEARRCVDWADLIIPIGGDGTFLLASKLVSDNTKPILGINPLLRPEISTFPLPAEYTLNVEKIFDKLTLGDYSVIMRSRIRTEMYGEGLYRKPFHVHEKSRTQGERRIDALVQSTQRKIADALQPRHRILPWLALNEIFMGEFLAARATMLTILVDETQECTFRSSGMCVCTGSGSRTWFKAMNLQSVDTIKKLTRIATGKELNDEETNAVSTKYHDDLIFPPEDQKMAYMIREMYRASTWPKPAHCPERQICHRLKVRSNGFDAGLILDASISLPFNDGTIASFQVLPEYALKNITMT